MCLLTVWGFKKSVLEEAYQENLTCSHISGVNVNRSKNDVEMNFGREWENCSHQMHLHESYLEIDI